MIRVFKKAFSSSPTVQLEVIKKSQIYGSGEPSWLFLTNRSNHRESVYPVIQNPEYHLNPGDKLTAQRFMKSHDGRRNIGLMVTRDSDNKECRIFSGDLKRYIKII